MGSPEIEESYGDGGPIRGRWFRQAGAAAGQTALELRVSATELRDAAEVSLPHTLVLDDSLEDDEDADILVEMCEEYGEGEGIVRVMEERGLLCC